MQINLKSIKYYFLTCNNEVRKKHILNEFTDYNITEVNPVMNIGKHKSAPTGFSRILDLASKNQDRTKPFQPFCIFEDDVKKYREFPEIIEVPDDSDILYIGLSSVGCDNTGVTKLSYIDINKDIIKINNMLACHGFIICSQSGLLAIQKCMLEGYFTNIVWDIFTSQIQPYYNVYALKVPLVYQYGAIGGVESHTKLELINNDTILMDPKLINKTNVSIITCYLKDPNIINKLNENYENKLENKYDTNPFKNANDYYNRSDYYKAITYYKNVLKDSKSNDEKYLSCLRIHESLCKINKEQDGIYYLIQSFHYDKQRFECVLALVRYYNIMGLSELAYTFYAMIKDYYENTFLNDYDNFSKKLDINMNDSIFYLPYFMIIIAYKNGKPETATKMFEIIFKFKYIGCGDWYLNNLLHNLLLFIKDIKKNKRKFYRDCKDYLELVKSIPNINKSKIDSLLLIIEEYNNKDYQLNFPIKIVNLKRRADRKEKLMKYLIKENVENYEFIEACDAYALEPTKEIYDLFKDNNFNFSKGVIGCAYSHMNLWKKLVSDPINNVYIILEDDAELTENFNKKLKICYEEFNNNNMEILYLGSHSYPKRNTDINNLQFISRKQISAEGTFAYMISKMGAFKILNYIKNNGIKTAIDGSQFYNQLISVNYTNESIIGTYFTFADSDVQRHTHRFSFEGINLN